LNAIDIANALLKLFFNNTNNNNNIKNIETEHMNNNNNNSNDEEWLIRIVPSLDNVAHNVMVYLARQVDLTQKQNSKPKNRKTEI
jgi:hypothetical protein